MGFAEHEPPLGGSGPCAELPAPRVCSIGKRPGPTHAGRWISFVTSSPAGRRFGVLNVVDEVTRERLATIPDTSISGRRVASTEFTSNAILAGSKDNFIVRASDAERLLRELQRRMRNDRLATARCRTASAISCYGRQQRFRALVFQYGCVVLLPMLAVRSGGILPC